MMKDYMRGIDPGERERVKRNRNDNPDPNPLSFLAVDRASCGDRSYER